MFLEPTAGVIHCLFNGEKIILFLRIMPVRRNQHNMKRLCQSFRSRAELFPRLTAPLKENKIFAVLRTIFPNDHRSFSLSNQGTFSNGPAAQVLAIANLNPE